MFRGLKSKLEKSLNQSGIKSSFAKGNQSDDLSDKSSSNHPQQGDETPIVCWNMSPASTSLVDLSEEPSAVETPASQLHPSAFYPKVCGPAVDHRSPAVLDLSNFDVVEEFNNDNTSNPQRLTSMQKYDSNINSNASLTAGRSRNSSVSSQMSDTFYFTPNPGLVSQNQLHMPHDLTSDAESLASEVGESLKVVDDRTMELVSREDLLKFYRKLQLKKQKYTGRYSQVVAAYKDLEKERDRLKEVLTKCQDKAFQRISELKEELNLKDAALNDVEVNYTMMLQEKEEVIKVLQMQVNILKQNFESEKLVEMGREILKSSEKKVDGAGVEDENASLKEKVVKMSSLLGNCKATILKHREEIKELHTNNKRFKQKSDDDQREIESLRRKVNELDLELKLQLEKRDDLKLIQEFSILQADHDALSQNARDVECDVASSNLKEIVDAKANLESRIELLLLENARLKERLDEISATAEKLLQEKEGISRHWRDKLLSLMETQDAQNSARSETASCSWATIDTNNGSAEGVSSELQSPRIVADDDDDVWKELEAKLKHLLDGRRTGLASCVRCGGAGKDDLHFICNSPESFQQMISSVENLNREKEELGKCLTTARTQVRIFRNLCECIFKAVISKNREENNIDGDSLHAKEANFNSNNNIASPTLQQSTGCLTLEQQCVGVDCSASVAESASESSTAGVEDLISTPVTVGGDINPLKVTRSTDDMLDLGFTVRHSILAILKDGLGQTMKILEEENRKKKLAKSADLYRLLPSGSVGNTNINNSSNSQSLQQEGLEMQGLRFDTQKCFVTHLETVEEDDEDWQTVDEDANSDGADGYIDDYENLFLGNEPCKNASLRSLLLNWKSGCERFEEEIKVSSAPNGIQQHPVFHHADSTFAQLIPPTLISDHGTVQGAHDKLKADYDGLLNNYSLLQSNFSVNLQSLNVLKEQNTVISEAFEKLQNDFNKKIGESVSQVDLTENVQNGLQSAFDLLREDYLKVEHNLGEMTSENVHLRTELSECNEHCEQMQKDLLASNNRCSQLLDESRRHQLEQNILEQDHGELREEHEKLLKEIGFADNSLKRAKESLSRLQGEHQILKEDHKSLFAEHSQLQRVEVMLKKDLRNLQQKFDVNLEDRDKIHDSLVKITKEASAERESLRKLSNQMSVSFEDLECAHEQLKSENKCLLHSEDNLKAELSNSKSILKAYESEIAALKNEICEGKQVKGSTDILESNLDSTKNELITVKENFDKLQIELEFLKGNLSRALDDNNILEEKIQAVSQSRDDLIEESSHMRSELNTSEDERKMLRDSLVDCEVRLATSSKNLTELEYKEKALESSVQELTGKLGQSESTFDGLQVLLQKRDEELSKLTIELGNLTNKMNTVEAVNIELQQRNLILLTEFDALKECGESAQEALRERAAKSESLVAELNAKLILLEKERECFKEVETHNKEKLLHMEEIIKTKNAELFSLKQLLGNNENERNNVIDLQEREALVRTELQTISALLEQEKLTHQKQLDHLRQQVSDSQREVGFLGKINEEMKVQLESARAMSEAKDSESAKDFKLKNEATIELWANKLKELECAKDGEFDQLKRSQKLDMEVQEAALTSLKEKFAIENEHLKTEIAISKQNITDLTTKLESLQLENDVAKRSCNTTEESFKLKIVELEESFGTEKSVWHSRERDFETQVFDLKKEISRLQLKFTESKDISDNLSRENLKNQEFFETEKESMLKEFRLMMTENEGLAVEKIELSEQLNKLRKEFGMETSELNRQMESLKLQLKEVDCARDALRSEVGSLKMAVEEASKNKECMARDCSEISSKFEFVCSEKVLLEEYIQEHKSQIQILESTREDLLSKLHSEKADFNRSLVEAKDRQSEELKKYHSSIRTLNSERELFISENLKEKDLLESKIKDLEESLKFKESELMDRVTELKRKAEVKFKQIKKQKDDVILASNEKVSLLEEQVVDLKQKLLEKDGDYENLRHGMANLKESASKKDLRLVEEIQRCKQLQLSLSEMAQNLQVAKENNLGLNSKLQQKLDDNERLVLSLSELEYETETKVTDLTQQLITLKKSCSLEDKSIDATDLEETLLSKKLESLEHKIYEAEKESEIVKKKNQSLKQELRRSRAENETNLKASELDKKSEIERLQKEYVEEMNERDSENAAKIKHLLKEFQIKLDEKEREYQDNFISSIEKFENENDQRVHELQCELKELREELKEKEEIMEEHSTRVEELNEQIGRLRSDDEWEELCRRNKELENFIEHLEKKSGCFTADREKILRVDAGDKYGDRGDEGNKKVEDVGSQSSLFSSSSSIMPVEFEYLRTILLRYMVGSTDKQTLSRVICRVMKFSAAEEGQVMEQYRK